MSRFVHIDFPHRHEGVVRVERALRFLGDTVRHFSGARGAAALMLAAVVSSLVVVANEVIETWTEGHLLAAWIVLWVVAFASMALFAEPARRLGAAVRAGWVAWAAARRQAIEDQKLWNLALQDARVMADLSRAMGAASENELRRYY